MYNADEIRIFNEAAKLYAECKNAELEDEYMRLRGQSLYETTLGDIIKMQAIEHVYTLRAMPVKVKLKAKGKV